MICKEGKYLITGATGLIGSALLRRLTKEKNIFMTCPVRNMSKVNKLFDDDIINRTNWIESPLEKSLDQLSEHYDYIIHCASPTASRFFVDNPVETMLFNIKTTNSLLKFASNNNVESLVYLSSLESYGSVQDDSIPITEDFQGYVNPLETRSSYNMAKRICESMCHAYFEEYKVPVKIVRLTQTISPYVEETDLRLFALFGRQAAKGEDIILYTKGTSARQYIHIEDAVDAILCVLFQGNAGEAYNAANKDTYISVSDLAEFVQKKFNPTGKVSYHLRQDMGYAPTTKIKLDTSKLESLGWKPKYGLYDMFAALIENLSS